MAGRQDFDIHLLMHPLLARLTDIGTANIEIPTVCNYRLVVARGRFGGAISCRCGALEVYPAFAPEGGPATRRFPISKLALVRRSVPQRCFKGIEEMAGALLARARIVVAIEECALLGDH